MTIVSLDEQIEDLRLRVGVTENADAAIRYSLNLVMSEMATLSADSHENGLKLDELLMLTRQRARPLK